VVVRVETLNDNNRMTLLAPRLIEDGTFDIFYQSRKIGTVNVISSVRIQRFDEFRFSTLVEIENITDRTLLTSGNLITLNTPRQKTLPGFRDSFGKDDEVYKNSIISTIDKRPMNLVEGGVTLIGSDAGDKDETPVHTLIVDTFYIDVYEVSNRDYLLFIKSAGKSPPLSWTNGEFPVGKGNHPVLVTYMEAQMYAEWAGKRLPTEFEWERAANGVQASKKVVTGDGMVDNPLKTVYPWGNLLTKETNFSGYWEDQEETANRKPGTLPVDFLKDTDVSYYGIVHMAGNISEWTSSYYKAYKGSPYSNIRYGNQVKVIRGGSYYSKIEECSISSRSYGGIPDLYSDFRAGFRCVKDINRNDLEGDKQ
jgi:formylglycine-generating enzyme required for sulfatase activity